MKTEVNKNEMKYSLYATWDEVRKVFISTVQEIGWHVPLSQQLLEKTETQQ